MRTLKEIMYGNVSMPFPDGNEQPILLSDSTMKERLSKVIARMVQEHFDVLVIYADLEHGSNFEYLTGFLPRFEEALLVLHRDGTAYMMMGNENLNKVVKARIQATAIHVPYFSLPNQPMGDHHCLQDIFQQIHIEKDMRVGIVGWKNFTSTTEDNRTLFDVPYYIVEEIKKLSAHVSNATYVFIGEHGVRCINNVNEIEHYEFGASLASDNMLRTMNHVYENVSEMALGSELQSYGQKNSVVTIAATGQRFVKANIYPTDNTVKLGDPISLTVGYKGGLSSRVGYAVYSENDLDLSIRNYLDVLVKPYYLAVVTWLEKVHCGTFGGDIYDLIEQVLPKEQYHWHLCPGHLTADEEWLSSPIYENSRERLESGMLFQIDIIPSVEGYAGVSAESTIALADENLRSQIELEAPQLWQRIQRRRRYIKNVLHINLHPDILPMCSTVAYLRPYLLEHNKAMFVE